MNIKLLITGIILVSLITLQSCSKDDVTSPEKEIIDKDKDNEDGQGEKEEENKPSESKTVSVSLKSAGSLKDRISNEGLNLIESLTLTGNLNGTDINVIRSIKNLSYLDISNANIVSGGELTGANSGTGTINNVISEYLFADLKNLKEIILPKNCIEIRINAFVVCPQLRSVTMFDKVTKICAWAFYLCSNLETINIPNSVKEIEYMAFAGCNNLKAITLPNSLTTLGVGVFGECKSLETITLSENIETIESNVFASCTSLKSITIPAKVKIISIWAFNDCVGLSAIHLKSYTPPKLDNVTQFHGIDMNICKLYIPKGSLSLYSKADVWKDFANIIEE